MACSTFESLDEEVKELLENYKYKKATIYEPCTLKNFKECLIGLSEEFSFHNVNYIFNPHIDLDNNILQPQALLNLINSVWTLLHFHKSAVEKAEKLAEQNHILEQSNKQLNGIVSRLKEKVSSEKNESRACVASAQRVADRSDTMFQQLTETRAKLTQLKKQKETTENRLRHEISRLNTENGKLLDKLRSKSGTYTPCSEVCDSTVLQLKERDKKQRAIIAQLQENNQQLLREVLAVKEELILGGLNNLKVLDENANNK